MPFQLNQPPDPLTSRVADTGEDPLNAFEPKKTQLNKQVERRFPARSDTVSNCAHCTKIKCPLSLSKGGYFPLAGCGKTLESVCESPRVSSTVIPANAGIQLHQRLTDFDSLLPYGRNDHLGSGEDFSGILLEPHSRNTDFYRSCEWILSAHWDAALTEHVILDCRFQNDTGLESIDLSRLPRLSYAINVFERGNRSTSIEIGQPKADLRDIADGFQSRSADVPHRWRSCVPIIMAKFASNPVVMWHSCGLTHLGQDFLVEDGVIGDGDRCVVGLARHLRQYLALEWFL
jgi:hypothetical protein